MSNSTSGAARSALLWRKRKTDPARGRAKSEADDATEARHPVRSSPCPSPSGAIRRQPAHCAQRHPSRSFHFCAMLCHARDRAGSILRRKENGEHECVTDEVAIEEPLEIRIAGSAIATTMRTPGHDEELAAGFLLSEAIVRGRPDVDAIAAQGGNAINVELAATVKFAPASAQRFGTISSSCGLCGKTSIDFIRQQFPPVDFTTDQTRIAEALLLSLPERLRQSQGNFERTGGFIRRISIQKASFGGSRRYRAP